MSHYVLECLEPEKLAKYFHIDPFDRVARKATMEATEPSGKKVKYYPVYIFVCHTGSILSSLIQLYTKDQWSHSLISFDATMTKMYSFGRKKLNNDDIVSGKKNGFAVDDINNEIYTEWKHDIHYATYCVFVTEKQRKAMLQRLQYFLDNAVKFSYDLPGLFAYAAHLDHEKQFSYFCSGFVADILQSGEVLGNKRSYSRYSPQDLSNLPMAYKVNEGNDFSAYRASNTKKKVQSAWKKFVKDSQIDPSNNSLILV